MEAKESGALTEPTSYKCDRLLQGGHYALQKALATLISNNSRRNVE